MMEGTDRKTDLIIARSFQQKRAGMNEFIEKERRGSEEKQAH